MREADLVVIGGGPAGMAASVEAVRNGVKNVVILERDHTLGGILPQCVHNGFGLHLFGEELTGPEYAERFIRQVEESSIDVKLNTMVLDITQSKIVTAVNSEDGLMKIKAGAIVLAMGCRERTRGALNIPGTRPSGIYTAGTAQRLVNMEGYMPGKKVVILGSGDIGLIMARRMTLEGAQVKMVCELMPYPGGLNRNIVQCLKDFEIPLRLSHTIVNIHGKDRLEGVTIAKVDEKGKPIADTYEFVECDTLLLSVGLIPENEISKDASINIDDITAGPVVTEGAETSVQGIFACGNVVYVHDLVDNVTEDGYTAGRNAAKYLKDKDADTAKADNDMLRIKAGRGVRCVIPQLVHRHCLEDVKLSFRVDSIYRDIAIEARADNQTIKSVKKKIAAPGEMESIILPKKLLESINSGEIEVCLSSLERKTNY
jgi:NADPH-dependent 2,4-dienoyl-CoA reductase/sulfur reductase-like enzyme